LLLILSNAGFCLGSNGFNLSYSLIPREEILSGGPPRDGIPALTNPKVISVKNAQYMRDSDFVIGVKLRGRARAYPLRILVWHELVNDNLAGKPILVSYCPLCNSAVVFNRRVKKRTLEFGVSGLLWNSNILMYDRQSDSLWSQIKMKAVTGSAARAKQRLEIVDSQMVRWGTWRRKHRKTTVLSRSSGYNRDYETGPYGDYFKNDRLFFPVKTGPRPARLKRKSMMILVRAGKFQKAYAFADIKTRGGLVRDKIGQICVTIANRNGAVTATSSGRIQSAYMYWFSLNAILPAVKVYDPRKTKGGCGVVAKSSR